MPSAIIFFGPDGSGKTTQAELLVNELCDRGIKTKRLWLRSLHTLAFVISVIAMHVLKLENVYEFRSRYSDNAAFRFIWCIIEFLSILPLVLFKFYLPILRGYVIVAERFVIDWIVAVAFATNQYSAVNSPLGNLALRLMPQNSLLVYIDANYDTISSRRKTEDTFEFIEYQRSCYKELAERFHALTVDSNDKTIEEVFSTIMRSVICEGGTK
jgi:thymidylate kinase